MTTTIDTMTDAELLEHLEVFEADMVSDGKPFNAKNLWAVASDSTHEQITDDGFLVKCAIASLMRIPSQGCRASHAVIGRRVAILKKLLLLADQVGWPRIRAVRAITG